MSKLIGQMQTGDHDDFGRVVSHHFGCTKCQIDVIAPTFKEAVAGSDTLLHGSCKTHSMAVFATVIFKDKS